MRGWETKKLGELAYLAGRIGWKGLTAKEYTTEGPLFVSVHSLNYGDTVDFRDAFRISQARYDESPEIMLEPNDILICKDGAGIGKVGIVGVLPEPATINSSLLLIRPLKNVVPKLLYHLLCSPRFQGLVQERIDGATTPHLYQREIREFQIALPPRAEQQRIVAILDEAFAGLETMRANAANNLKYARELFDSRLNGIFLRKGEGWVKKSLNVVGRLQTGTTPKSSQPGMKGTYVPFVKPGDFKKDGRLDYANEGLSESGLSSSRLIKEGAVLMVCIGATIGKTGFTTRPVATNQQINSLTPFDEFDGRFIFFQMRTTEFQNAVLREAGQATLPIINKSKWGNLELAFPPTLVEQASTVEALDELWKETEKLESLYQRKVAAIDELKQSILHKAFSGELAARVEIAA